MGLVPLCNLKKVKIIMQESLFLWLWLAALGLVSATAVFYSLRRRQPFPYTKQETLFTPAERAFFAILDDVLEPRFLIFGKVRLADIIKTRGGLERSAQRKAFYKIMGKHVDFVICKARDLSVVGVIELDDRSHERPDRRARDIFVDGALAAAGVPIAHIKVQRRYAKETLRAELARQLGI